MKHRWIHVVVMIAMVGACAAYVALKFDFGKLKFITWTTLLVGLAFLAVSLLLRTIDSQIVLRSLGEKVRFRDIFAVNLITQVANISISSSIAVPLRVYLYKTLLKVDYPISTVVVSLRVLLDGFVTAILGAVALSLIPAARAALSPIWPLLVIAAFVAAYMVVVRVDLEKYQDRGFPWIRRMVRFAVRAHRTLKSIPPWIILAVSVIQVVNVVLVSFFILFLLRDLGGRAKAMEVIFANSIANLVSFFSMVPMGLGTMEASFIFLIGRLGCPEGIASVAIVIKRVIWSFLPMVAGVPVMIWKGVSVFSAVPKKQSIEHRAESIEPRAKN